MRKLLLAFAAFGWMLAGGATAADLALVVSNASYRNLARVADPADATAAAAALREAGFEVIVAADADGAALARAATQFVTRSVEAERLVVVLSGNFVRSTFESWLMPVDAPEKGTLIDVARNGLGLRQIYPVPAAHPGRAVIVTGSGGMTGSAGPYLAHGMVLDDLPQGVTAFFGTAADTSWFVRTALARPGVVLSDAARRLKGITTAGYLPDDFVLLPAASGAATTPVPLPDPDPQTEAVFWEATRKADTLAAYEAYLRRYPNGPHTADAQKFSDEIRSEPNRAARLVEEGLALGRDQRREIQRALVLLGHDTRGIDGIFGSGSRKAITEWQTVSGFDPTGYLTRDEITALSRAAKVRSDELERAAEAKRREDERRDRDFWAQTGEVGDEAGLRAYIARYPDGIFAGLADERLKAIEAANRARAAAEERTVWDQASGRGDEAAYRDYLQRYPKGTFAAEAQARIDALQEDERGARDRRAAAEAEEALGLNQATRLLVERRLDDLGFEPGTVDGTFDGATRRAIRRYQSSRGIRAAGYLNEATVVRLLADVFGVPAQ